MSTSEAKLVEALMSELEKSNQTTGLESTGACLISTPGSPRPTCAMLTKDQCSKIGGTFVGGKCP